MASLEGTKLAIGGNRTEYALIDAARFLCALLVVAIHTRPLSTYTELGNFLLDKGICRVAVPFFFVASGYFWAKKPMTAKHLGKFLRRVALLYVLWTAVYYPIVAESQDMNHYLRRCLLSGSYYHLWYYPAMITAAVLTFCAWKLFASENAMTSKPSKTANSSGNSGWPVIAAAFFFYIVGCMGESYYGLFTGFPGVVKWAEAYFALFWSTRSGLFFGFFFFALGTFLQKRGWRMNRNRAGAALLISLALMFAEIMTLRRLDIAKDYNLYFSLIPATLFLFLWLIGEPSGGEKASGSRKPAQSGKSSRGEIVGAEREALFEKAPVASPIWRMLRKSSVLIYGIHLWFKYYGLKYAEMVMAGMAAQGAGAQVQRMAELFVNNSFVQYLAICGLSIAFAAAILALERIPALRFLKYLY